jgi:vitamin B12 transporter
MKKLILLYAAKLPRFTKAVSLLLIIFLLPGYLFAQADTSKKLKEIKIQNAPIPQVQSITPAQQVNSADFSRYSALTVADAMRNFSGVNIKDYGGIGGLKTVSVRSLGANHLAVLYDGIQLSDAQNGQIDLGKLNLNNIQSIILYNGQPTVICQPARSYASASVLAVTTIKPMLDSVKPYQLTFGFNGGSFGLVNPYLQWQQQISKRWSFIVNSYLEKADGKYKYKVDGDGSDTLATRINSDFDTKQTDAALYWNKSDSNKFNLHINYYNSDRGLPGAVVFYSPYSAARLTNQDFFTQAGYERIWNNGLHLLINSKFSRNYLHYINPAVLKTGGENDTYTQYELYQSVALAYNLTNNWQISYAADAAYTKLDANQPNYLYPNRFTLLNSLASNFTVGKWIFQGSLLQTNTTERVNSGNAAPALSILSPTVVANYNPTRNLQLRAFYKDIFRDVTFNEQYYFAVVLIRNIRPEYARQFDMGLTYRKGLTGLFNYVALTADGYYNRVTDKIVTYPSANLAVSSIINIPQVDIKGLDASIKTELNINISWKALLSGNYTYQQANDVSTPGAVIQIPYTPQNSFAVNGGIINGHFGAYYNQIYSSSRYYINDNSPVYKIPGYSVSDVTGVYRFGVKGKPLSISATCNNIFNNRYAVVRSFPMPGRSLRLSLQITI